MLELKLNYIEEFEKNSQIIKNIKNAAFVLEYIDEFDSGPKLFLNTSDDGFEEMIPFNTIQEFILTSDKNSSGQLEIINNNKIYSDIIKPIPLSIKRIYFNGFMRDVIAVDPNSRNAVVEYENGWRPQSNDRSISSVIHLLNPEKRYNWVDTDGVDSRRIEYVETSPTVFSVKFFSKSSSKMRNFIYNNILSITYTGDMFLNIISKNESGVTIQSSMNLDSVGLMEIDSSVSSSHNTIISPDEINEGKQDKGLYPGKYVSLSRVYDKDSRVAKIITIDGSTLILESDFTSKGVFRLSKTDMIGNYIERGKEDLLSDDKYYEYTDSINLNIWDVV